jgi:hypothetical protein
LDLALILIRSFDPKITLRGHGWKGSSERISSEISKRVRDLLYSGMAEGQASLEPPLMDPLLFGGPSSEEPFKKSAQMEPPLFRDLSPEIS